MNLTDVKDEAKGLFDRIPDIAFDWYARLVPGIICAFLVIWMYHIDIQLVTDNLLFSLVIAYIIGHLLQPFSSGILQGLFVKMHGKKLALLLKAYAELVGFASCFLFSISFLLFIWMNDGLLHCVATVKNHGRMWGPIVFFLLAIVLRLIAYNRKYGEQNADEKVPAPAGEGQAKKEAAPPGTPPTGTPENAA